MLTAQAAGEDDHLAGLHIVEAVDARDAVAHRDDLANLVVLGGGRLGGAADALLQVAGQLDGGAGGARLASGLFVITTSALTSLAVLKQVRKECCSCR
jgi:hypothetical protein